MCFCLHFKYVCLSYYLSYNVIIIALGEGKLVSEIAVVLFVAMESFGGQRLLQRADINVGSNITSFFRIRARTTGKLGGKDLRHLTCFGKLRNCAFG